MGRSLVSPEMEVDPPHFSHQSCLDLRWALGVAFELLGAPIEEFQRRRAASTGLAGVAAGKKLDEKVRNPFCDLCLSAALTGLLERGEETTHDGDENSENCGDRTAIATDKGPTSEEETFIAGADREAVQMALDIVCQRIGRSVAFFGATAEGLKNDEVEVSFEAMPKPGWAQTPRGRDFREFCLRGVCI